MFSRNWNNRERTIANEELLLAIEELRQRPRERAWFIPLKIDNCEIPSIPIGPGETLAAIQHIDIPALGWNESLRRLLVTLGVSNPILDVGEPLGSGLGGTVELVGGELIYDQTNPPMPTMAGLTFPVVGGWCSRTEEGHLLAFIKTKAPFTHLQELNALLGLDSFYAISNDGYISSDVTKPNAFEFERDYVLPAGTSLYLMQTGGRVTLPNDLPVTSIFIARGILADSHFWGSFEAELRFQLPQQKTTITMKGRFDIIFRSIF
jgi:hypothetical protein